MKKTVSAISAAIIMMTSAAFASSVPDHRGTDLEQFETGTKALSKSVTAYNDLFKAAGEIYGVDPNILAAVCMQESGGRDVTAGSSRGIMQIGSAHEKDFAAFGLGTTGISWTLSDRSNPEKSIAYAAYLLSKSLYKYDNDYAKTLQAYNFGDAVFKKIIDAAGNGWLAERKNARKYVSNWPYSSYGDALYIEHVLRYYHDDIEYNGAKVMINDKLLDLSDQYPNFQYPLIKNEVTLVPIRIISEYFGAEVGWNDDTLTATIKKDDTVIELCIGAYEAYKNGETYELEAPVERINNRTMVPIRFVAESIGFDVDWDGDTRTVLITN